MAEGLRERKKRHTREHISAVATRLFVERGFDQVTVAEVAEAANVSRMTVFNYFPRKEDLYLDRYEELWELFTGAIERRAPGESVFDAVRHLLIGMIEQGHPLSALLDDVHRFWAVVRESEALRARVRERREEMEDVLTEVIARETARPPHDPTARLASATICAVLWVAHAEALRRLEAGERADDIRPDHVQMVNDQFDLLASGGLADLGRCAGSPDR
ncbi:transcriptional regulator, TetR family [Streptoalloteichus tenebrarius]|uniref:Transcriptional regulator, TetR family n=1 Tax=Streptoalloteichus tenebrarius (strain ATCC 17920 / DSM 40477 / JCM 4838 / CBS 697.72 / NBRC 16177 / NCIMB 11028 / NRRL B-12390 / A12253. 1 / ISP 5477) TaxID=1933 RepID=A0ABT1HYL7_STRSD|nr:TetR family transcriptional regulator [Streptoalloteichus tenebrarius]MCP2260608.1 transcriptional regulator, TetR family [Streptoalloteichus tenebrarius]BFF01491.1 TetR/AcrR family transcriptional regulator [Streptoalloteichus tenebrarius]